MRIGRHPLDKAPRRRQVYDFIKAEVAAGNRFPTHHQIAAHMGWQKTASVQDCLLSLARFDRVLVHTCSGHGQHAFALKDQP